jgi:hypothetical protein
MYPFVQKGKSIFEFFWIFNFQQFAIDGKNNSKTKVEKGVFLYFHVFLCGNEFFKTKNHKIGSKIFFFENRSIWGSKNL